MFRKSLIALILAASSFANAQVVIEPTTAGGGGGGGIGGSGTLNFLPIFTAAAVLGDSAISDIGASYSLASHNFNLGDSFALNLGASGALVCTTGFEFDCELSNAGDGELAIRQTGGAGIVLSATGISIGNTSSGDINLTTSTSGDIFGTSAGSIVLDSAADLDLTIGAAAFWEITDDISIEAGGDISIEQSASGDIALTSGTITISTSQGFTFDSFTSAGLPAAFDGTVTYCSDCNPDATCTAVGPGSFAFRVAGAWVCELN